MVSSKIEYINGRACLIVDGKRVPSIAYITYFDERTHCQDFAKAGYDVYSLCASFNSLPLNPISGFSPLFGIFDVKGKPDYSQFDYNVRKIIEACPTAKIFPRVRISMPAWWVEENPDEVCPTRSGSYREALFSDKFRESGAKMLREFIAHVQASDYCDNVIGYQIAGGGTEEWFHFDINGSLSPCSEQKFNDYLAEHYPDECVERVKVPERRAYAGTGIIEDPVAIRYLEFVAYGLAESIAHFAHVAKECVNYEQIVGTFFGYSQAITSALRGTFGVRYLLQNPDIDFFCSTVSYANNRSLGMDWNEPCPGRSYNIHHKLYFLENDVRTFLSQYPDDSRPGVDPTKRYNTPLWLGPATEQESVWAVRKAFSRALTHATACWWFDMWGGWFASEWMMQEMARYRKMMDELTQSDEPTTLAQVAILIDETYAFRVGLGDPSFHNQKAVRDALGNTGIPFDTLDVFDYRECENYSAVLFSCPEKFDSPEMLEAKEFLRQKGIPFVQAPAEPENITPDVLRDLLVSAGAHCYCDTGDVIYHGNGYLVMNAATAGKKTVKLPYVARVTPLDSDGPVTVSDTVEFTVRKFETLMFKAERVD